ncbi:kelch-like protein 13 [Carassius gibelio]|uniref:kelch-like protein 13 n=1 Tax=Carassius gibelio TaxID=101364 RepID=UPI0022784B02|nr:kelch-like protein 13 [Carassius gibelio]
MAINQQCLQKEWRRSGRSREDENSSSDTGRINVSEEECEENPGEQDEWTEKEDPKEQQVNAWGSEKTVDDDEGCSVGFPFMTANSDSFLAMCNDKVSEEKDVNKYDNNNNTDAVSSNSCSVSDNLVNVFTINAGDDADKHDDKAYSVSFPAASANSDGFIDACTNNEKSGNEDADKYEAINADETYSKSPPVASANSDRFVNSTISNDKTIYEEDNNEHDNNEFIISYSVMPENGYCLIAACTNDDKEDVDKKDDKNNNEEQSNSSPVMSIISECLVASLTNNDEVNGDNSGYNKHVDINGNKEYIRSLPVTSANGDSFNAICAQNYKSTDKDYDKYDKDNENDSFATASFSTGDIGGSKKDLTFGGLKFRDEEQHMTDSSSEQELINQKLEEEDEEEDDHEYDGSSSFEDSEDEDCGMYPKKLYSDPAYPGAVFQALENMMLYSVLTDLTLFTEDGYQFQVHSFVLAAVSNLIQTRVRQKPKQEQYISLYMGPRVHGLGLAAVVEFAYTGNIGMLNKGNIEWVWSAAVSLEAPRILELCKEEEEREEDEARGKKVDRKEISAEEHLKISLQQIRQMWTQRMGCDVELEAEGRVFHAHRALLAASSDYFRGMFTSGMKESQQELVSLLLVGATKFEALLHYTYSGALALGWNCVFDLTCTSLQFQFQTAFSLCLSFLQQEIDAYSCLDVASFAEAYGMAGLLALADDFVLRHFQDVSITPKFKDLSVEKLKKYLRSDSLCVPSELPVFKAVMCWIEASPRKRLKLARELMGTIQFPLMTFKEFKEVKSITSLPRIGAKRLYNSLLEEFCSNSSDAQSNFRSYMPKETLVLVGGERITDNFDKRRLCRDIWFSNSLQNHVGLVKKIEWRMLGTLPEKPRFSHGVGVMRGKLYVVGGRHYYGKADTMNCTYRYDPIQNFWQRLADMHETRGSFTLVVLNGKIYAIGGERDSEANMESVEVYCPNTDSWSFVHPLDHALCCHAASVWNGTIFLSGGFNSQYQCLSSMTLYHPERGSTSLAEMTHERALHCMETLGDRLYVAGGVSCETDGHLVDQLACEVYDPVANSWSAIMPFPVPHVGSASAVLEGKVYIIGGYCQEDYNDTKTVHRFDPTTERWENMSVTPGPNTHIAACVLPLPAHLRQ